MRLAALSCIIAFWSFNSAVSQRSLGQPSHEPPSTFNMSADSPVRIAGGEDTNLGHFPWQASIQSYFSHICGGAIISRKHIVTATHCLEEGKNRTRLPLISVTVIVGTNYLRELSSLFGLFLPSKAGPKGVRYQVEKFDIHEWDPPKGRPSYSRRFPDDIAVITLKGEIIENENQRIIPLATEGLRCHDFVFVSGFGMIHENPDKVTPIMQSLKVRILDDTCEMFKIAVSEIASLYPVARGICKADSGGPVMHDDQLVGIVSGIIPGLAGGQELAIYQKVLYYKNFIENIMKRDSEGDTSE